MMIHYHTIFRLTKMITKYAPPTDQLTMSQNCPLRFQIKSILLYLSTGRKKELIRFCRQRSRLTLHLERILLSV
jgi:hypothetical protein